MENWKKILLAGTAGASVILLLKRQHTAGLLLGGLSLATLASEYPEEFARIRRRMPEYVERGLNLMDVASRAGEKLAQFSESRATDWYEALLSR